MNKQDSTKQPTRRGRPSRTKPVEINSPTESPKELVKETPKKSLKELSRELFTESPKKESPKNKPDSKGNSPSEEEELRSKILPIQAFSKEDLISFFEQILSDIKADTVPQEEFQRIGEFFISYKMVASTKARKFTENDIMKYFAMGWFIYDNIVVKDDDEDSE